MKILGMVGGLGPESTIDYYSTIISQYREKVRDDSYPLIIINSIDVSEAIRLVSSNNLGELTAYLAAAVQKLAKAGADFALFSANTPHIVFNELRRLSPLPLISIVEATCNEVKRLGMNKVSLLGTRFTMNGRFYPEVFEKEDILIVPPTEEEQAYIHDKYVNELVKGIFLPETQGRLLGIIAAQKERDHVQGVILGGTELPLILRESTAAGLPLLNTTEIHVRAAVAEMLS